MSKYSKWVFPLIIATLHFLYCIYTYHSVSEGSWRWFRVFVLDLPISLVLVQSSSWVSPLILFGIFGSIWWYFISSLMFFIFAKFSARK